MLNSSQSPHVIVLGVCSQLEYFMKRLLLLLLFFSTSIFAVTNPTHEYRLKNGLTLIVREDHRSPVVISSVWYRVGGSYESDGTTGISHMLEHMMFKGTKHYGPGVLIATVTDNGGQQNAMTSDDFTAYYQMWSADKLPLSFKFESDRMRYLSFDQNLYDKEHQVVMEERRMRIDDNPQAVTLELFNAAAHVNNPYHHPVIGWMTDVQHLTLADLKRWYHTWYAPNNAIVIVVGDVKSDEVYHMAQQYFGVLKPSVLPTIKPMAEIPQFGERDITVNIPAKLPCLLMGYPVPELTTATESWQPYALDVLANVLSSGDSSRLIRDLVRGKQIALSASAFYNAYRLHDDLLMLMGIPANQVTMTQLKEAYLNEIKQLQEKPVSHDELERVKAQLIANNVYQKDSIMYQMYDIGIPESIGLSWKTTQDYINHISRVTPEQIQAVAKLYLTPNKLTVGILVPKAS